MTDIAKETLVFEKCVKISNLPPKFVQKRAFICIQKTIGIAILCYFRIRICGFLKLLLKIALVKT